MISQTADSRGGEAIEDKRSKRTKTLTEKAKALYETTVEQYQIKLIDCRKHLEEIINSFKNTDNLNNLTKKEILEIQKKLNTYYESYEKNI